MVLSKRLPASVLAASLACAPAFAHEGHDHGPGPVGPGAPPSPRVVADSEAYQLVGVLEGEVLVIYLDRARSNEPVAGADLEVAVDAEAFRAEPREGGTYEVAGPALRAPGEKEVVVTVREGGASDLLVGALRVPAPAGAPPAFGGEPGPAWTLPAAWPAWPGALALGAALLAGFLLGAAVRGRPRAVAGVLLAGAVLVLAASGARAHEGHDHGPAPGAGAGGDAPARRPDGSIFLPKATQRLLEVRTTVVEPETAARTQRLAGRVIPNPDRSGVVQSTIPGRIAAPPGGLPRLGQAVRAGEVLGYVQPAFASIDASDMRQTMGDLEQRISLVSARLERLRRLAAADIASRATLEEAEIELRGLHRRRDELRQAQSRPEPLLAPVDGVVAEASLVVGQVVAPSDVLLRVVDPSGFWIEALVHDRAGPDALRSADATAPDGAKLALSFVGRGRALQQQAALVHFEILDPPANLDVGAPVTVTAATGAPVTGIVLPRTALAQAPNGQTVVFQHREAELFVPKAVRVESLDAERVLVLGGLARGDKVVVRNAPLVNQVR